MIKLILHTALVSLVLLLNVYGQNEISANFSEMKEEDLLINLSSDNGSDATRAAIEIFKRGERMLPFLLKMKGNKSISQTYCLGDPLGAMGIRLPSSDALTQEIEIGIKNGWYVTNEVVALYLISAIYYDNLAFAQVPYLTGNKPVKEKRYNTPERIKKAWKATEKWYKKLEKNGLTKLRNEKEFPLKSTEIHFYGTNPERKRDLSNCEQ